MKRNLCGLFVGAILITIMALPAMSQVRTYSSYHDWYKVVDSTADPSTHTDSLTSNGTTGNPIFYTNIVSDPTGGSLPTKLDGYMSIYITLLDTGTAAATMAPDTAQDTIYMQMFTAWKNPWGTGYRTGETQLCSLKFTTPGVGTSKVQGLKFNVPADSALGDVVYWRIRTAIHDSDYSVARVSSHIHYRAGVTMNAR